VRPFPWSTIQSIEKFSSKRAAAERKPGASSVDGEEKRALVIIRAPASIQSMGFDSDWNLISLKK
jgi:hypothetical protein